MTAKHPLSEDLVAYSAGTLTDGVDVMVACHLTFCPGCRDLVSEQDALGAGLWIAEPPSVSTVSFSGVLERLDDSRPPPSPAVDPKEVFPAPLRHQIGPFSAQRFRRVPLGVGHLPLPRLGGGAFLLDLPAGLALPSHRHAGVERALVLAGGFQANGVGYRIGDVSIEGDQEVHDVVVDNDGRCVCLFVNDGRIVAEHPWLRLVGDWLQQ